jgi:hypothetical protein
VLEAFSMSTDARSQVPRRYEDVISGIGLILFALGASWVARDYPVGTASSMGPGYFPRAMCAIIGAIGALIAVNNLRAPLEDVDPDNVLRLRPLLAVTAAYIMFALSLKSLGLLPAILVLIVISGLAIRKRSALEWILVVVALETLTLTLWYVVRISVPLIGGR